MTDALGFFPATRVLLATPAEQGSYWLEQDVIAKARALTALEVDHVVVPPTPLTVLEQVVFGDVWILTAPGVVMTPQSATEALVDVAVECIGSRPVRVADVGTGTGAVAVAVALRAPAARVWATDDSEAAIALARTNVARHRLQDRVEVLFGNLLEPVPDRLDLVVANLPYHAEARSHSRSENARGSQPKHALYTFGDGLQLNRELIEACRTRLDERGVLVLQLYGSVLSAGRGELDELLQEMEARAAEGWQARAAAAAAGKPRRWKPWHASPSGRIVDEQQAAANGAEAAR
jgi:HemK-like putative methylase